MPNQPNNSHRGFVRLATIIGNKRTGARGLLPLGSTTWWNGVKSGRFPQSVRLGPRITAWRYSDIEKLLEQFEDADSSRTTVAPNSDRSE